MKFYLYHDCKVHVVGGGGSGCSGGGSGGGGCIANGSTSTWSLANTNKKLLALS